MVLKFRLNLMLKKGLSTGERKNMKVSGFQIILDFFSNISEFIPSSGKNHLQLTKQNIKSGLNGKFVTIKGH